MLYYSIKGNFRSCYKIFWTSRDVHYSECYTSVHYCFQTFILILWKESFIQKNNRSKTNERICYICNDENLHHDKQLNHNNGHIFHTEDHRDRHNTNHKIDTGSHELYHNYHHNDYYNQDSDMRSAFFSITPTYFSACFVSEKICCSRIHVNFRFSVACKAITV